MTVDLEYSGKWNSWFAILTANIFVRGYKVIHSWLSQTNEKIRNPLPYPQSSTFGPTPLLIFPPLNYVLGYSGISLKSVNNDINILMYSIELT